MRLVVVAATWNEVAPVVAAFGGPEADVSGGVRRWGRHDVDLVVTGVGMVATAAHLSRALTSARYDLALNFGVCGSFDLSLPPGTVVHVVSDRIAELGAEDHDAFLTVHELGLLHEDEPPFRGGQLVNPAPPDVPALRRRPAVSGITVNTAHGNAASIEAVVRRFRPQVESMEGAAFMYACLIAGVPFAQVRAVSNTVAPRDRGTWRIEQAISALGAAAEEIVRTL
jgi:futalosine hydrolase